MLRLVQFKNNSGPHPSSNSGFTLIELLIVVVLIGILAGFTLGVLKPKNQKRKADEAVARENVEKLAIAMSTCLAARKNPETTCNNFEKIGARNVSGTPRSNYIYQVGTERDASGNLWGYAELCTASTNRYTECSPGCRMRIRINPNTGIAEKMSRRCLITF